MCGIIGIYRSSGITSNDLKDFFRMMIRCERRGRDASGAFNQLGDFIKSALKSSDLVKMRSFVDFLKKSKGCKYLVGHCRQATRGNPKFVMNDHPIFNRRKSIFLVHNGIISCKEYDQSEEITDTWIFMNAITDVAAKDRSKEYLSTAVKQSFTKLCGISAHNSSVIVVGNKKEIVFAKSYGKPLLWNEETDDEGKRIVFGSEFNIICDDPKKSERECKELGCYKMVTIRVRDGKMTECDIEKMPISHTVEDGVLRIDDRNDGFFLRSRQCQMQTFPAEERQTEVTADKTDVKGWGYDAQGNVSFKKKGEDGQPTPW